MRRFLYVIAGAIIVVIVLGALLGKFVFAETETVSATNPTPAAQASDAAQAVAEKKTDVTQLAASATSEDGDRRLWIIVHDETKTQVSALVTLSRQIAEGEWSVMTGKVGAGGLVKLDQHEQDLVEGTYLLVVSKSLGKRYTRDYHATVRVEGPATTAQVTYTKIKIRTKTRVLIKCVVKKRSPGANVTYGPPSSAPSYSPGKTYRPRVHVNAKGKGQAVARARATGSQAQASAQSATITQRQSGSCGNNCAVSNNANGNINQNTQQQQTSVGGSGSGTSTASGSARASSGSGKSECVEVSTGSMSVSTCP